MKKGAPTSIIDNKPLKERKEEKEAKDRKLLEEQSKLANISKTEAGTVLIEMITHELTVRVQKFIDDDPECSAYNNMLKKIHLKEVNGKTAVNKLVQRYYPAIQEETQKEPAV